MDKIQIDEIRARCDAATPGPWDAHPGPDYEYIFALGDGMAHVRGPYNAEFIAHARQDIPALLDALEAERARADAAEQKASMIETMSKNESWTNWLRRLKEISADRDRLETRCEALVSDIKNSVGDPCYFCNHRMCKYPCGCINFGSFEFDEKRYVDGKAFVRYIKQDMEVNGIVIPE